MNPLTDFMAFVYLDSFLFVAGLVMTVIGVGYAIVEWVLRWHERREDRHYDRRFAAGIRSAWRRGWLSEEDA